VHRVARHHAPVTLAAAAREELGRTRHHLEAALARGEVIYGVNTGFGALSETRIRGSRSSGSLQQNLLRSHAVGVGSGAGRARSSARCLLLRAHTLALGASAASPELAEFSGRACSPATCDPIVPSQGSVGASGDLAPLAHLALAVIGEGEAWFRGPGAAGSPRRCMRAGLQCARMLGPEGGPQPDQRHAGDDGDRGARGWWTPAELLRCGSTRRVHQVEGLVDALERHDVGDQVVDVDLAVHVPVDDLRHVGAAARAAEGRALPDPAGDQLERPRAISWPAPATPMMTECPSPCGSTPAPGASP
jgi:hypothetical protein